jgi:hypothetical protein
MCAVIALVSFALVSCSGLTTVDAPDLVQPRNLENATGALARRAGALSRFATAFANQVIESGLLADEFTNAGSVIFSDRRTITASNTTYPFAALSLARIDALRAIFSLQEYAGTARQVAELYAIVGMIETLFAENLCSPVPVATVRGGAPVDAPPYRRDALLRMALAHFDSAEAQAMPADSIINLIRVGRARALVNLGDLDAASSSVVDVPLGFAYTVPYSASVSTQSNRVFQSLATNRLFTIADREGGNGLPFISAGDARLVTQLIGRSSDGVPVYNYAANGSLSAPITLASGVEGLLVQAEAALRQGDVSRWAALLNQLRRTAISPAMSPLPSDSTIDATAHERLIVQFRERAFWLFGRGRRHGDLRRLVRQYGRDPESVFPTGLYQGPGGGRYGSDVTFVPQGEEPNSGYSGCQERGA